MARNKGKRPGTASGSTSQPNNGASDAASNAASRPEDSKPASTAPSRQTTSAASSALAAKIDSPGSTTGRSTTKDKTTPTPASAATLASRATTPTAPSRPAASGGGKTPVSAQPPKPSTTSAPVSASAKEGPDLPGGHETGGGNSGGFWPGLLGGLVGGAATALAASMFWIGGDDGINQIRSTTDDLDSRLAATESQAAEIATLAERVAAVEAAPAAGDSELAARLDEFERQLASIGQATGQAGSSAERGEIQTLSERLTAAEEQLAGLADVEQQLAGLSGEIEAAGQARQATETAMSALQTALPKLEDTLAVTGTTVEETGQQTTVLAESVETMGQAAKRLGGDVAVLAERVGETEKQLDFIGGEYQRAAAMVVSIGDVDRAVARGEPYASPLQSLQTLSQNDTEVSATLATLEPMAAAGAPTRQALKNAFGEVASQILLAEKGDTSLTEQVSDNVFGIINMRPAGAEVEGSDARAIVARAQAKLSNDDLAAAVDELGALEGRAAEAANGWIGGVNNRLAAETAIADLRAHAQSLLAKGS